MKINKNDPRLTAYLLNEISKEDRLLVEQALLESAEIREELEKLRKSLGLLSKKAATDDDFFKLTNQQRQQIFDKISDSRPNFLQRFMRGPWGYATAGLVTASFALMVFNHSLKDQASQKSALTKEEIVAHEMQKVSEAPLATSAPVQENESPPPESDMAMADAAPESLGAASAPAPSPEPQMAVVAERKKSVSSGAAFGGGSMAEGASKGSAQNFAKMKQKDFADSASSARAGFAGPSSEFLLQTEPALPQNLREKLHAHFQDCLFSPDSGLTSFKLKWDGAKASDVEPSTALNSTQKSCIEAQLKNTLGIRKDILVIKVNSVSK